MPTSAYEVEPLGQSTGQCDCCGKQSRSIWGIIHRVGAETVASYFAQWTDGADLADHPATIDMIIGAWGEGTGAPDRVAVSLSYRVIESGPSVMVIDAKPRKIARNPLVGAALGRDEVVDTPFAAQVLELFDEMYLQDARFKPQGSAGA